MRVRVVSVHQSQEGLLGNGGRKIFQLSKAIQAQLPHAQELALEKTGPRRHVGQERRAARRESCERRQREVCRIAADVNVVGSADSRQRIGDLERGQRARAFVRHVRDERREPFEPLGIGSGSTGDLQVERDDRHVVVLDGADAQAVPERVPHDRRKHESRIGTDVGKPRSIDSCHDTDTAVEPSRASAC